MANEKIGNKEEVETNTEEYFDFFLKEINPKYEEIIEANSFKERRKIQIDIVSLLLKAGYNNEAKRTKAIFNL